MKIIIIDTNFLLIPYIFKVDIFEEINRICNFKYQLCVLEETLGELNKIIKEQKGKHAEAAKFALKLVKWKHLKILDKNQDKSVDDIIVDIANTDTIVATQDAELKQRLKENGVGFIVLRQKKYLNLIGV